MKDTVVYSKSLRDKIVFILMDYCNFSGLEFLLFLAMTKEIVSFP